MYSPEFLLSVYPARPGVYQVKKFWGLSSPIWHYSYWNGRCWAITCPTPGKAVEEAARKLDNPSIGIYCDPPTYTHWRGLSSPSSEA